MNRIVGLARLHLLILMANLFSTRNTNFLYTVYRLPHILDSDLVSLYYYHSRSKVFKKKNRMHRKTSQFVILISVKIKVQSTENGKRVVKERNFDRNFDGACKYIVMFEEVVLERIHVIIKCRKRVFRKQQAIFHLSPHMLPKILKYNNRGARSEHRRTYFSMSMHKYRKTSYIFFT